MSSKIQCAFIKADGARCAAYAMSNSSFCFMHDPARAKERRLACQRGAEARNHGPRPRPHPETRAYIAMFEQAYGAVPVLIRPLIDIFLHVRDKTRRDAISSFGGSPIPLSDLTKIMISALKVHAAVRLTDQPPEPTPPCPEHGRRAAPRPRRRVFAASPAPPSTLPAPVVPPPAPPSTATPSNTTPSTHRACPSPERDKRSESSSITNTSPNKTTPPAPDTGGAAAQIMKREGPFTLSASGQPSSEQESRKAPAKLIGGGAAAQNPKSKIQNPNVPASADKSAQVSAKPESSSSQAKRPGLNCPRALYPYSHYLQARREGRSTNKRYMPPLPSEHSPFQELTTTPPPSEHLRETCDNTCDHTCGTTAEAPSFPSRTAPTSLRPPRPDS